MKLILQLIFAAAVVQGAFAWYGGYYKETAPLSCGDELDYHYGTIQSAGYPAGDDNTNECVWMKYSGNSSKVCYDICFYSQMEKLWSKFVCIDLEANSECGGDVHLSAENCDGDDLGFINIDNYGISGQAAPGSAYEITYKCMEDEPEAPCEDKNKKCKKLAKKCNKPKIAEMCPMTCGMCDDDDDSKQCEDKSKKCQKELENGKGSCDDKKFVKKCMDTCGKCDDNACEDMYDNCQEMLDEGKSCDKGMMKKYCKETCDLCDIDVVMPY